MVQGGCEWDAGGSETRKRSRRAGAGARGRKGSVLEAGARGRNRSMLEVNGVALASSSAFSQVLSLLVRLATAIALGLATAIAVAAIALGFRLRLMLWTARKVWLSAAGRRTLKPNAHPNANPNLLALIGKRDVRSGLPLMPQWRRTPASSSW